MVKQLQDLKLSDYHKMILTFIGSKPEITVYEICAKLGKSYSSLNQNLGILTAMGLIHKHKSMRGKTFYTLDKDVKP